MDSGTARHQTERLKIGVLARACYPFHGHGGLERHVYDLVRHLLASDVFVTLITPPEHGTRRFSFGVRREPSSYSASPTTYSARPAPPRAPGSARREVDEEARRIFEDPRCTRFTVPYRTFPFAGRRGTTVIDRSTAYPLFGMRAGRVAANLVRRGELDVVYGVGASVLGYARARERGATAPLVFNPQGLEEFGATDARNRTGRLKRAVYGPLRRAVRACARAADCVIATDRVLEPVVRRHLDVEASRVRVIPNAIDLAVCDRLGRPDDGKRMRAQHGIAPEEIVLLSVGRLQANKGFPVLAQALARVSADMAAARVSGLERPWRWVIVGDGPYRPAIERAIASNGLRDRVVMTGATSDRDLHAWYEAATLFVHPTLYEGSSIVTLEAMAHRRAVLATEAGGLPDKVRPEVTGWLVPPGDADALASALHLAFADVDRLTAMGQEGRAVVEAHFSWSAVAAVFLDLCQELLERGPSARRLP